MSLKEYQRKRNFSQTPEPSQADAEDCCSRLRFVVHKHAATRLHYDLRLELEDKLMSWAVPKGPSLNPLDQRLAVKVEDHPISYAKFEGIIPKGQYGSGQMIIWDQGTYVERGSSERKDSEQALKKGLQKGHITFLLHGEKLRGEFALVRLKESKHWLLLKKRDAYSSITDILLEDASVVSGLTIADLANSRSADQQISDSKPSLAAIPKVRQQDLYQEDIKSNIFQNSAFKILLPQLRDPTFYQAEFWYTLMRDGLVISMLHQKGSWICFNKRGEALERYLKPLLTSLPQFPNCQIEAEIWVQNPDGDSDRHRLLQYRDINLQDVCIEGLDIIQWQESDLSLRPFEKRLELMRKLQKRGTAIHLEAIYKSR